MKKGRSGASDSLSLYKPFIPVWARHFDGDFKHNGKKRQDYWWINHITNKSKPTIK